MHIFCSVLQLSKQRSRKTVKLSLSSSPKLESRYASIQSSKRPNRPHISSDILQFQRASRQKPAPRQSLGAPPTSSPGRTASANRCIVSVKRYLGPLPNFRKWKMSSSCHFSHPPTPKALFHWVDPPWCQRSRQSRNPPFERSAQESHPNPPHPAHAQEESCPLVVARGPDAARAGLRERQSQASKALTAHDSR